MTGRTVLLNPGPVTLSDRVRKALTRGDWCHREPEFAALTRSINEGLIQIYEETSAEFQAVTLTGSGSCAVEAMLATFAPDATTTLVVANGVYGERMASMLTAHGKPNRVVRSSWIDPINLDGVRDALQQDAAVSHIAVVHHETTTGRLNDLPALARLARDAGCQLLLDAVSSFGAEEIDFDRWPIAAVAATANKCLHAVPGVCFVLARRELWQAGPPKSAGSLYLDPFVYHEAQHGDGYSPFTQSVQAAFALDEALNELADEGGWQSRRQLYRDRAARIAKELRALDFEPLLPPEVRSCVLCGFRLPAGVSYSDLHGQLKRDGFIIYAGQGHLASDLCRVANMGDVRESDFTRLFESLRRATGRRAKGEMA